MATFKWHVTQPRDLDVLEIEPVSGTLQPGEFCKVKFTFVGRGNPSFYDLDVICEIVDETLLSRHRRELADWTNELERQRTEFMIDEGHADADVALEGRLGCLCLLSLSVRVSLSFIIVYSRYMFLSFLVLKYKAYPVLTLYSLHIC